jgi:hypothetical protein
MSNGSGCKRRDHRSSWQVTAYKSSHSAFNGYRHATSDYSEVTCTLDGRRWRTKAAYVEEMWAAQKAELAGECS